MGFRILGLPVFRGLLRFYVFFLVVFGRVFGVSRHSGVLGLFVGLFFLGLFGVRALGISGLWGFRASGF